MALAVVRLQAIQQGEKAVFTGVASFVGVAGVFCGTRVVCTGVIQTGTRIVLLGVAFLSLAETPSGVA